MNLVHSQDFLADDWSKPPGSVFYRYLINWYSLCSLALGMLTVQSFFLTFLSGVSGSLQRRDDIPPACRSCPSASIVSGLITSEQEVKGETTETSQG